MAEAAEAPPEKGPSGKFPPFGSSWLGPKLYARRWKGFREAINLLLVALNVLAASVLSLYYTTVPRQDLWLVLAFFLYLFISDTFFFPRPLLETEKKNVVPLSVSLWVQISIAIAFVLSFVLPWIDIWITNADRQVLELVSPHAFCFSSQVLVEFWFYRDTASTVIRILTPVIFNAYRITKAWVWFERAIYFDNLQLTLATCNLILGGFTLFFVLLLRVLPNYLRKEEPKAE